MPFSSLIQADVPDQDQVVPCSGEFKFDLGRARRKFRCRRKKLRPAGAVQQRNRLPVDEHGIGLTRISGCVKHQDQRPVFIVFREFQRREHCPLELFFDPDNGTVFLSGELKPFPVPPGFLMEKALAWNRFRHLRRNLGFYCGKIMDPLFPVQSAEQFDLPCDVRQIMPGEHPGGKHDQADLFPGQPADRIPAEDGWQILKPDCAGEDKFVDRILQPQGKQTAEGMSGPGEVEGFPADDEDFGFRFGPERGAVAENFQRFDRGIVFMFAAVDFFRPAVMIPVSGFASSGGKVRRRFFMERVLAEPFETFGGEVSQNIP